MILVLNKKATKQDIDQLIKRLEFMGFTAVPYQDSIAILKGVDKHTNIELFTTLPYVEKVIATQQQFMLAGKEFKTERTVINIKNKIIGGEELTIIAGPCSIESEENIFTIAESVAKTGTTILRGGAFKPRSSPYDFQGLGEQGLIFLENAAQKHNLLSISEVMDISQIVLVAKHIDILQIGARNMQNFSLLKAVGKSGKPILLKRGFSATYKDFLLAAEYILNAGNPNVILCERGIRTFETYTRNTLDIAAVPVLHQLSHLPVFVDPSHGTGIRELIVPMAKAAVAAGADGIMVEIHPRPDEAFSDAKQTIDLQTFIELVFSLHKIKNIN